MPLSPFDPKRPKHIPRFVVELTMAAEVIDDRVVELTEQAMRNLQEQAAAYLQVAVEQQLLDRLNKHLPANLAQFAVTTFLEEMSHMYLKLEAPKVEVLELRDADQDGRYLTDVEILALEDDISDGIEPIDG